jgi:Tol biopolymer transport system component
VSLDSSQIDDARNRWNTRACRVQPPIRFLASCLFAIVLALAAVDSTTTASPGRAASSTASPSLVWSTWVWVENTPGKHVQQFTLWIGSVDGSPRRVLGQGRDPQISPDGRWIAYSDSRAERTYLVSRAGGRPWLAARNARPVRWSQTSRYLATVDQGRALYVTDVETRRRVTIDRGATILGVSISPSAGDIVWGRKPGRASALDSDVDIFRARIDGSQRTRLTRGGKSSFPVGERQRIAFSRGRSSGDKHFPVYELWTMRPSGRGHQRVTRSSHAPFEWSADGRRLLTSTNSKSGSVVSVIDMQTGSIRPLIRGQFVIPLSLSKDGRSILAWALSPVRKPEGDLVRVDWNGRQTTLVRNAGQFADWNL